MTHRVTTHNVVATATTITARNPTDNFELTFPPAAISAMVDVGVAVGLEIFSSAEDIRDVVVGISSVVVTELVVVGRMTGVHLGPPP